MKLPGLSAFNLLEYQSINLSDVDDAIDFFQFFNFLAIAFFRFDIDDIAGIVTFAFVYHRDNIDVVFTKHRGQRAYHVWHIFV